MKNNYKVSVIIPVFNNLNYVKRCLTSVLMQSYKNLEILILNGAPNEEEANEILKDYSKYKNVKIIKHPSSFSLFEARVFGIKNAKGDYIAFIDSDDEISIDYFRILINKAKSTDADIVIADTLEVINNDPYYFNYDPILNSNIELDGSDCFDFFVNKAPFFCRYWNIWNKIYKRDIVINNINLYKKIGAISMGEDIAFSAYLWKSAKRIRNVHNVYYFYRIHNESSTGSIMSYANFEKSILSLSKVLEWINTLTEKYENKSKLWKAYIRKIWKRNANLLNGKDKENAIQLLNKYFANSYDNEVDYEYYFDYNYSEKTKVNDMFYKYEYIKNKICSEEIKIISFDIFDTLLKRNVFEPSDIFLLMDKTFNELYGNKNYIYFSKIRKDSEDVCRRNNINKEEITLDDIYDQILKKYNFDSKLINKLKKLEIELELKYNVTRNIIKELYELAKYNKKKIICISDMYLSKSTIQEMLSKNNYNVDEIYVSSELMLTKETGNIYKYVKNAEAVQFNEILHIGDNYKTDYENAKKLEINAFHIPKILDMFTNSTSFQTAIFNDTKNSIDYYDSLKFLGNKCALSVVANHVYDNSIVMMDAIRSNYNGNCSILGYFPLGLALFSHVYSIFKNTKKKEVKKVNFVSRDGFLLKKGYDIFTKNLDNHPESNYLYCSRKLLMPLSLSNSQDILSLFYSNQNFNVSPEKFYNICDQILNISKDDFEAKCQNYDLPFTKIIENNIEQVKFIELLNEIFDSKYVNDYRVKAKEYYEKILHQNSILVDIGYSGRAESIFTNLLGYPISSYYIHTNNCVAYDRSKFNNFEISTFFNSRPKLTGIIREYLYMELNNSCIKIKFNDNNVSYEFDNKKFCSIEEIVNLQIQKNALQFIDDFVDIYNDIMFDLNFKLEDLNVFLEKFLYLPDILDAKIFSIVNFDDEFEKGSLKNYNLYKIWTKQLEAMNGYVDDNNSSNVMGPENIKKRNILKRGIVKILKPIYKPFEYRMENIIRKVLKDEISSKMDSIVAENIEISKKLNKNRDK